MKTSFGLFAMATIAIGFSSFSQEAAARPDCNSCVPDYQDCVASGATDCNAQYAVCLRFCPIFVTPPTAALFPQGRSDQQRHTSPAAHAPEVTLDVRKLASR